MRVRSETICDRCGLVCAVEPGHRRPFGWGALVVEVQRVGGDDEETRWIVCPACVAELKGR